MPQSIHKTQKAAFAKARKLEKAGKMVRFNTVISQEIKKGKRVGKQKREHIVIWK